MLASPIPLFASSHSLRNPTSAEHQIQLLQLAACLLVQTGDELHDALFSRHTRLGDGQRTQTAQRPRLQHASHVLQRLIVHVLQAQLATLAVHHVQQHVRVRVRQRVRDRAK